MQYTENYFICKKMKLFSKKNDIFIFAQNIDCGYTLDPPRLEPPRRGKAVLTTNEYPPSIFWSKKKKNRYTPTYPSFYTKSGVKGGI